MNKEQYTLGFIGIGLMGRPMTLRLLNAGFRINVWNRTRDKLSPVASAGATICESIEDVAARSDIILLCLADTAAVESVVNAGITSQAAANKLLIDLSSIHPETTRKLAAQLQQSSQMSWVDAPVSGGVAGAEQGTLAIMAGGEDHDIEVAREVLAPLYRQLTHMGSVGSGQATKICNQMIVSCNVMVIAEMMAWAQQAGVTIDKIPDALSGGFADSIPLQITGRDMAREQFEPVKWRVKTLLKDLRMSEDIALRQSSAIPMSTLAAQLLQLHAAQGYDDQDPATLIKLFDRL